MRKVSFKITLLNDAKYNDIGKDLVKEQYSPPLQENHYLLVY